MRLPDYSKVKVYIKITAIAVSVIFVAAIVLFVEEYEQIVHGNPVIQHQSWLTTIRQKGSVTASDTASIQTWMTFDYINYIFNLPPTYLQTSLSIANNRYPHLTVTQYAKSRGQKSTTTLVEIQNSVKAYLTQNNE